jgi:hypothetical protein
MQTTGEIITNNLRFFHNIGSDTVAADQNQRDRARYYLTILAKDIWDLAPHWFRLKNGGSISLVANDESATMPSDFSHQAEEMQIYLENFPYYRLQWQAPDEMQAYRRTVGAQSARGRPAIYTISDRTALGIPKLQVWPKADRPYTLLIDGYVRLMPDLVDRPGAPTVAVGSATGLTGVYSWKITFVTASGETEAGVASSNLTLANQKANLSAIPVSPCRSVTSRKIYRTAAGGATYKLVTTLSDNTTTTYTDNTADGSLGAEAPGVAAAVTGLEQFPEDVQERLFAKGLRTLMGTQQGDLRANKWEEEWRKDILRFWGEYKQGRNEPLGMPRYGVVQGIRGGYWPRWY